MRETTGAEREGALVTLLRLMGRCKNQSRWTMSTTFARGGGAVTVGRLRTAGKTFEEIAEELESDVATVRRWITGFRE